MAVLCSLLYRFMHEVHCYLDGLGDQLSVNELGSP